MSALLSMYRTVIFVLLFAVLTASGAFAAPRKASAKVHPRAVASTHVRHAQHVHRESASRNNRRSAVARGHMRRRTRVVHRFRHGRTLRARREDASLRVPRAGMPTPLLGSLESLERQNTRLDAEGLERIEDETDLENRIAHHQLVPVPVSNALAVNPELPATHRYCRPWTARFLTDLAQEHETAFHRPLEVSSAVRTVEYQKHLMHINGNAAPAEGDIASPHLTGATVDLAKKGLSRAEIAWMREHLLALQTAGKIDVEEEFRQACFHITVYKEYAPSLAGDAPGVNATNPQDSAPVVAANAQGL